jgi:hypothetical protein
VKQNFGSLVAEYRGRQINWREKYLFLIPASMVPLTMLAYGLWRHYYGYLKFGPIAALEWSFSWFLFALLSALLVLFFLILRLRVAWRRITLYENGIIFKSSPIRKQKLKWSRIEGIAISRIREHFLGNRIRDHIQGLLTIKGARPIKIDQKIENNTDLIEDLKKILYPQLLPKLKKDLQSGNTISFGKVTINHKGLRIKRRFTPWEHISSIYLHSGYLVVELQPAGNHHLSIMSIVNLELLLYLIDEHIDT